MSGDYSRSRFDPRKDFAGVLMQQGRVQLDADWNEMAEILDRRARAHTVDVLGAGVVPRQPPGGFEITIANGTPSIGRGRIYVDGLLAENHGEGTAEFDAVLAEARGTSTVAYDRQPYIRDGRDVPAVPTDGTPYLVYVDVWQREVTAAEEPGLIEPAIGVDTTARLQTAWQVKVLTGIGPGVTCQTPNNAITGWEAATRPSGGRLSTAGVGILAPTDPCTIPPAGDYRGLENQLYRVEIHDGGPLGTATFKFSRDNASVVTAVTEIHGARTLVVSRTQWDPLRRFNTGDWVEVLDDSIELSGRPRVLRQIETVDDATRTITLEASLPAGEFPIDPAAPNRPYANRHTRLIRWDQSAKIHGADGTLVVDLDDPLNLGLIPIRDNDRPILLENGVQVTFHLESDGVFKIGDHWTFAARAATTSVEMLDKAPPRGIHHHYCRLAVVTGSAPDDCRVLWPPEAGGEGCACSVCVTPESHESGAATIQRAITDVKDTGGTVCLHAGIYRLGQTPVTIEDARAVTLKGQGVTTVLLYSGPGHAMLVEESIGVTVEDLTVMTGHAIKNPSPIVALRNTIGTTIQRCSVLHEQQSDGRAAVGLDGIHLGLVLRECLLAAPVGVASVAGARQKGVSRYLLTAAMRIHDNVLACAERGVHLDGPVVHAASNAITRNIVYGGHRGGIVALGATMPGGRLEIDGNEVTVSGDGIVVGSSRTRVRGNDVVGAPPAPENTISKKTDEDADGDGIVLVGGASSKGLEKLDLSGLNRCQVTRNRITGVRRHGISLSGHVRSATITRNDVIGAVRGGIVMESDGRADLLRVERNDIDDIGGDGAVARPIVGIGLVRVAHGHVIGNVVTDIGRRITQAPNRAGIHLLACRAVRVAGNEITRVGPSQEFFGDAAGIDVELRFDQLEITDNTIERGQGALASKEARVTEWWALRVHRRSGRTGGTAAPGKGVEGGILEVKGTSHAFIGQTLVSLQPGREALAVRGNVLDASGRAPAAEIVGRGPVVFTENRCLCTGHSDPAVVVVEAGAIVLSNNYVEGPKGVTAVWLVPSRKGTYTVLGNIANGDIVVDQAPLGAPWAALNVITP